MMSYSWFGLCCLSVVLLVGCSDGGDVAPDGGSNPLTECSDDECGPAPGTPSELCFDGSMAGPVCGTDDDGRCGWTITSCPDACDLVDCDEGMRCELVEVQCVTTPCPPQPQCIPNDCSPEECPMPAPGAPNILCDDGTVAGPACVRGEDRTCGWVITTCP